MPWWHVMNSMHLWRHGMTHGHARVGIDKVCRIWNRRNLHAGGKAWRKRLGGRIKGKFFGVCIQFGRKLFSSRFGGTVRRLRFGTILHGRLLLGRRGVLVLDSRVVGCMFHRFLLGNTIVHDQVCDFFGEMLFDLLVTSVRCRFHRRNMRHTFFVDRNFIRFQGCFLL